MSAAAAFSLTPSQWDAMPRDDRETMLAWLHAGRPQAERQNFRDKHTFGVARGVAMPARVLGVKRAD